MVLLLVYHCLVYHLLQILLVVPYLRLVLYVLPLYPPVLLLLLSLLLLLPQITPPIHRSPIHRLQNFSHHLFYLRLKRLTKLLHFLFIFFDEGCRLKLHFFLGRGNNLSLVDFLFQFEQVFHENGFEGVEGGFQGYLMGLNVVDDLICEDVVVFSQKFYR